MFELRPTRRSIGPNDPDPNGAVVFGLRVQHESEFKIMLDALKALGVPYSMDWQPCRGSGEIGKDDALQQAILDAGHNFTTHATNGIQIGDEMLVFFTGGSGDHNDDGAFVFSFNVKTRVVTHNTKGRKIVCKED